MNTRYMMMCAFAMATTMMAGCANEIEMRYPPKYELPELPVVEDIHVYKAPLYWSVYEYCIEKDRQGIPNHEMDLTSEQWDEIIDMVASTLLPYGYDMVCTDGFIPMLAKDSSGYMTHYGSVSLKDLVSKCKAKGLRLGVYDNPLWIHGSNETKIEGTDYTFSGLYYDGTTEILNPGTENQWFNWAVAEHKGAKEFIDGFFRHYKELGVDYVRMDFLSWYEDGKDRNIGIVGHGYGRESYARALSYIAESAKKYGIFTSLVMPHLYNDAELESRYGNMVRIVCDTGDGGWWHASACDKGKSYTTWPNCMNMFDGFTYWSHIAGRDKVILDGDFIRLNTFSTDAEKESVVSLQLMAGGPVTPSDMPDKMGDNVKFYTNTELLELNKDRFVGHPLTDKLGDKKNEIWYGQMSNGDYVVGLFNRDDEARSYNLDLKDLGIDGEWKQRDLWLHADKGSSDRIDAMVSPHGCKIVRLSK